MDIQMIKALEALRRPGTPIDAYSERSILLAHLVRARRWKWKAVLASDPDSPTWPVLHVQHRWTGRQIGRWHIAAHDWPLVANILRGMRYDEAAQWDGHTTAEKYARLA